MGLAPREYRSWRGRCACSKKRLDNRIASLIGRLEKNRDCKHCNRMRKRLIRERDHLFTFLETDGVEYHNNRAERAIRPCVILRKNSNGSRSKKGADATATLMSIKQTCKAKGDDLVTVMREGLALLQKLHSFKNIQSIPTRCANSFLQEVPSFSADCSGDMSFKNIPYPRSSPDHGLVMGYISTCQ